MLASMAPSIAGPVRPTSARGRGRFARDAQGLGSRLHDPAESAPLHRSNKPHPDADSLPAGPGQFRNFASDSRFELQDPLNQSYHDRRYYDLGAGSETDRDSGRIATLDISKHNAKLHNWQRTDTFQTPHGHARTVASAEIMPAVQKSETVQESEPCLVDERLRKEVLEAVRSSISEVHADMLSGLRSEICEMQLDVRQGMCSLREELVSTSNRNAAELQADIKAERSLMARLASRFENFSTATSKKLDGISKGSGQVDFSPILKAIQTTFLEVLKAMDERLVKLDLSPILAAINNSQVDLSPCLAAIGDMRACLDVGPFLQAIKQTKLNVDCSEVLSMIARLDNRLDFDAVLGAIQTERDHTIDMVRETLEASMPVGTIEANLARLSVEIQRTNDDVFASLPAIEKTTSSIASSLVQFDFSPVLEAIRLHSSGAEVMQTCDELRHLRTDLLPLLGDVSETRRVVDLMLKAIQENKSAVGSLEQTLKTQYCDPELIKDIHKVTSDIDFPAITKSIQDSRWNVDFSMVLRAIHEKTIEVDFDDVFRVIRESNAALDLSSLLQSNPEIITRSMSILLEEIRGHMSLVLKAIGEVKAEVQPVQEMIRVMDMLPANHSGWTPGSSSEQLGEVINKLWETQQLMVRTGASHQDALQEMQKIAQGALVKNTGASRAMQVLCDNTTEKRRS